MGLEGTRRGGGRLAVPFSAAETSGTISTAEPSGAEKRTGPTGASTRKSARGGRRRGDVEGLAGRVFRAVRGEGQPLMPLWEACRATEVAHKAQQAVDTGRPLALGDTPYAAPASAGGQSGQP